MANEYLLKGDKKKALELYQNLSKSEVNTPLIYNNYFNTLLDESQWEEAQNLLKRVSRRDATNIQYQLDQGLLNMRMGDMAKAERQFRGVMEDYRLNPSQSKAISDYFTNRQLFDYAIEALDGCRSTLGNTFLFSMDMAMLYRLRGDKDKMVNEYLNYVTQSSASTQYVKNVLQAFLTRPDELESLEKNLYEKVQRNPDMEVYTDLLIWVTLQQKNF
ncbi:MAG: tetratricopeptide repeat protein, partial [Flammeovirgaceae bacterium]|nr:tetratricopeptide repeat protein [Flammeovirgaceae bacterium]